MTPVDRAIMRVAAPLQYVSAALARGFSGMIADYVYLVDVKQDNNKLAYENARLRAQLRELTSEKAESDRLRRLLGLQDRIQSETASAVVVGKDTTEYFRVAHLLLDKPDVTLPENMPVVSLVS